MYNLMWHWERGYRSRAYSSCLDLSRFPEPDHGASSGILRYGRQHGVCAQSMEGLLEQGNFIKILSSMGPAAQQLISQAAVNGLVACQGSDLLIGGLGGLFIGLTLSEKMSIPFIPALLYPFTPTREFPSVLSPLPLTRLPSWANRLSHRLAQQMMWQTFRRADNKARIQVLKIAPASFWGPFSSLQQRKQTILYGYSFPQVIPFPKDWDDYTAAVPGYWFLEPSANWEPPIDLVNFLQSGPPPIYIGFGSMVNRKPEETTDWYCAPWSNRSTRGIIFRLGRFKHRIYRKQYA